MNFEDASVPATSALFSHLGEYVLRLEAKDGELTSVDEVSIAVASEFSREDVLGEAWTLLHTQPDRTNWKSLVLIHEYDDPVVFMQVNSYNKSDEVHVRLRNIANASFQFQMEEWEESSGKHGQERLHYMGVRKRGAYLK